MQWPITWNTDPANAETLRVEIGPAYVWAFLIRGWHNPGNWQPERQAEISDVLNAWGNLFRTWLSAVPAHWVRWTPSTWWVAYWAPENDTDVRRPLYRWMAAHHGAIPGLHTRPRFTLGVAAVLGTAWCLRDASGKIVDLWGPPVQIVIQLAERASPGTVWVDRTVYDRVYTYMPGRARPPVRVRGAREALLVYQIEWGLPGRYLVEPIP